MCQLKEHVRAQYQRMQALLELNQTETMQMLESTFSTYVSKNSQQVVQLNETRYKAEKLLNSLQTVLQKSESMNFMKVFGFVLAVYPSILTYTLSISVWFQNTKPYHLVMDR